MRRRLSLTAALLLTAMLAACGSENAPAGSDNTAAPAGDTTPAETEYQLPTADFGGRDFNIMVWQKSLITTMEETGDIVDDAIYRRNRNIEELYNLKLKYNVVEQAKNGSQAFGQWSSILMSSILSGDDAIQLAGTYLYGMTPFTLQGGFTNVLELPHVQYDRTWWPQNLLEAGNLGGSMYILVGNIDPDFYGRTVAMFFNKKIAEEYKLGNLYELVRDGKWTMEKMQEMAVLAAKDIDGNAQMDEMDQYGLVIDWNRCTDSFLRTCDITITETGKDGNPALVGLTEKHLNLYNFLKTLIYDSGSTFHKNDEITTPIFTEGRGLFAGLPMLNALNFRDLDLDFGIIPYPKWDDKQEEYLSFSAGVDNAAGYCIPITADGELGGTILEALAYYGYEDIMPVYYEKVLKGKNTLDDESAEMLDLIFNNISFDFCQIYSYAFGDQKAPTMLMRQTIKKDTEIASTYEADKQLYEDTIASLIDALK